MAGRPRRYADNAERQKAYRQRSKALRNCSVEEIQSRIDAHNAIYKPCDPVWITQSAQLFDAWQAARRAARAR